MDLLAGLVEDHDVSDASPASAWSDTDIEILCEFADLEAQGLITVDEESAEVTGRGYRTVEGHGCSIRTLGSPVTRRSGQD